MRDYYMCISHLFSKFNNTVTEKTLLDYFSDRRSNVFLVRGSYVCGKRDGQKILKHLPLLCNNVGCALYPVIGL